MHFYPDIILFNGLGDVYSADFSPEGSLLGSAHSDGSIRICYPMIDEELWKFDTGFDSTVVRFSKDGHFLVAGGWRHELLVYDVSSGERYELSTPSSNILLRFNPSSGLLATVGPSGTCTFWDLDFAESDGDLDFSGEVADISFSPDGTLLAVCQETEVRIWDVVREGLELCFQGHQTRVTGVVFSPDGRHMASGEVNGTLILWDVHTLKKIWSTTSASSPNRLAFNHSGQRLAVACNDRSVPILDARTGKLEDRVYFPQDIFELTFSSIDQCLAVAGRGSLRIWREGSRLSGYDRFSRATAEGWVKPHDQTIG